MISFKNYLEERESVDRVIREEAKGVYDRLKKFLKMMKPKQLIKYKASDISLDIPAKIFGGQYKDLVIQLVDEDQVGGAGAMFRNNRYDSDAEKGMFGDDFWKRLGLKQDPKLTYIVLPNPQISTFFTDYTFGRPISDLITRRWVQTLNTIFPIFLHEFVHYKDLQRWKGGEKDFWKPGNPNLNHAQASEEYFNSPAEFNAYYHQGVPRIRDDLDRRFSQDKINKTLETFGSFWKTFRKYYSEDFLKKLDQRNSRALKKRLYDLFSTLKDEYYNEEF